MTNIGMFLLYEAGNEFLIFSRGRLAPHSMLCSNFGKICGHHECMCTLKKE
jgi:hypothetical protein